MAKFHLYFTGEKKKKRNNMLLEKANNLQQDVFSIIGLDSFDPERI